MTSASGKSLRKSGEDKTTVRCILLLLYLLYHSVFIMSKQPEKAVQEVQKTAQQAEVATETKLQDLVQEDGMFDGRHALGSRARVGFGGCTDVVSRLYRKQYALW